VGADDRALDSHGGSIARGRGDAEGKIQLQFTARLNVKAVVRHERQRVASPPADGSNFSLKIEALESGS
jgi:hypothetical protein